MMMEGGQVYWTGEARKAGSSHHWRSMKGRWKGNQLTLVPDREERVLSNIKLVSIPAQRSQGCCIPESQEDSPNTDAWSFVPPGHGAPWKAPNDDWLKTKDYVPRISFNFKTDEFLGWSKMGLSEAEEPPHLASLSQCQVCVFLTEMQIQTQPGSANCQCTQITCCLAERESLSHEFGHLREHSWCNVQPERQNCELQDFVANLESQESTNILQF